MYSLNIRLLFLPTSLIIRAIKYGFDYLNWKPGNKVDFSL